jgi:hypothetical protein
MRPIIRFMMLNEELHKFNYDAPHNTGNFNPMDAYMRTGRKASPWWRERGFEGFLAYMRRKAPPLDDFFSQLDIEGRDEPWL